MNRDTATAQNLINMTDQVNPWGSTTYSPNGSASYVDSQGRTVSVPRYTQTTTFTPEQQEIFDRSQQAQSNIAGIAQDQSAMLGEYLNSPFEFNNQDAADWAYDMGASRIRPEQQRNEEALRTRLTNQGIRPGTAAWGTEMTRQTQGNTDQWNQLALTGRGQAFSEALATRNQPINEITALLSGSQVSNPAAQSGPTPQAQVGGVDYAGLVNSNYQARVSQQNALLGGLFGLAGAGVGAATGRF
ncbi:MAG: tail fiber domain-containing protein [Alphaproteobacteria bacterium]|nr:MAG: tail fiber domain-containing protein [Alphaproteobacteria bacterium]